MQGWGGSIETIISARPAGRYGDTRLGPGPARNRFNRGPPPAPPAREPLWCVWSRCVQ